MCVVVEQEGPGCGLGRVFVGGEGGAVGLGDVRKVVGVGRSLSSERLPQETVTGIEYVGMGGGLGKFVGHTIPQLFV